MRAEVIGRGALALIVLLAAPAVAQAEEAPDWAIAAICKSDSAPGHCAALEAQARRAVLAGWPFVTSEARKRCLSQATRPEDQTWRVLSSCLEDKTLDARDEIKTRATPVDLEAYRREIAERRAELDAVEQRRRAAIEARERAAAEARRRAEEDARRIAEAEAKRRAEEEARRVAAEAEARRAAEAAEARRRAEEDARRTAANTEAEAKRRADEAAARDAADAAARQAAAEAETRRRAAAEARKAAAEAEARRRAEEDQARLRAEVEARRKAEETARRLAEETAARRRAEAEAQRLAAEAEARQKAAADAARQLAAEAARKREADAEAQRLAAAAAESRAAAALAGVATKAAEADQKLAESARDRAVTKVQRSCQDVMSSTATRGTILFAVADDTLQRDSFPTLDRIAAAAKVCTQLSIAVDGHASAEGGETYNQALSERRAKAIVAYLTQAGVDAGRLRARGYGRNRPVATNATEAGRIKNRRIEFVVTLP